MHGLNKCACSVEMDMPQLKSSSSAPSTEVSAVAAIQYFCPPLQWDLIDFGLHCLGTIIYSACCCSKALPPQGTLWPFCSYLEDVANSGASDRGAAPVMHHISQTCFTFGDWCVPKKTPGFFFLQKEPISHHFLTPPPFLPTPPPQGVFGKVWEVWGVFSGKK